MGLCILFLYHNHFIWKAYKVSRKWIIQQARNVPRVPNLKLKNCTAKEKLSMYTNSKCQNSNEA